jgi:hypothetical protein
LIENTHPNGETFDQEEQPMKALNGHQHARQSPERPFQQLTEAGIDVTRSKSSKIALYIAGKVAFLELKNFQKFSA